MRAWKELRSQALEGTAKGAAGGDAEGILLKEAGWLTLRRLAGYRPVTLTPAARAEAPDETRSMVSRRASARLEEILRTDDHVHLTEWLQLATMAAKLAPPSLLPPLLERGAERSDLRGPILDVGGRRIRWLAARNEDWAFAAIADPQETFRSGIRAARVAALAELRRVDPAAAVAKLSEAWSREGGDDRAALLPALAIGLGPGDEEFLVAATTDGRKEVRRGAADLLARLSGSALIARMTDRADTWIKHRKGILGGKLEVNPPVECDAAMSADGIEAKAPKGVGERAHWLRQVLALVPPSHWPPEILDLAAKSDWSEPLLIGWREAALRFHDPAWCELLTEYYLKQKDRRTHLPELHALVRATPADRLEAILLRHLQRDVATGLDLAVMGNAPLAGSVSLALILALERGFVKADQRTQQYWVYTMRQLASRLDPGVQPHVVALIDKTAQAAWAGPTLQSLAADLQYRAEMAKEIQS